MFCWCRSLVLGPWFSFQEWAACYTYDDSTGNEEGPNKKNMRKPKTKALKKTVVKTGTRTGKKPKVFVYGRVSSKKQIDGTGFPRQKQAALQRAKLVVGKGKFPTCNEVVSGTKPLDQRKVLGTLMSQKTSKSLSKMQGPLLGQQKLVRTSMKQPKKGA